MSGPHARLDRSLLDARPRALAIDVDRWGTAAALARKPLRGEGGER